ncbi:MAG: hypothetical protein K8D98_01760, partial [Rhodanobacter sp.]|nr:hypothetical protein [Rhodanobacter sp.]
MVPTGWAQLDRELPGGGWPSRAITEVLTPQPATTEWRLLGPALRQVAARGGSIIAVAPPREPYLPGLRQAGLDERGFVWIEARTLAERLWATEQLIRANASSDALHGLATWALQFTPRVAIADEAVLLEVAASTRLFGGRRALHERISSEARTLGAVALAWAPNSLAALACARAGVLNGVRLPLPEVLDALALHVLSATRPHQLTLAQLGCRTLGEVRRLPRGGLTRRFGQALLQALDQAYGLRPEAHGWI